MNLKPAIYIIGAIVLLGILFGYVSPAIALLIGMVVGISKICNTDIVQRHPKVQSKLLQLSVIGLGFGVPIKEALTLGSSSFFISLIAITLTFVIAFTIGRILGSEKITTILVASGTAICGGSAIAAVSPSVQANSNQTSIALAIVFLLNAVALFIFPTIGHFFDLNQTQFGLWCAIAIHDTSSVIGASSQFGEIALNVATTTKLIRTLWIIPLVLIISFGSDSKEKFNFPWFILGFLATMILSSYIPEMSAFSEKMVWISRKILIFTLFLIGLQINMGSLKKIGANILIVGSFTWIVLAVISLLYIVNYT
ncbi:YeiH family protein [Spongiimicrobium salis]|uniref:YeiH family protein n=1 Tax=Spongiimicrobium salis TaxID=1667022 RepID=UPI00374D14E0